VARPGRWRRFVVRPLFWALALAALAVVGVRWYLGTAAAREQVRALVAARLSEALGRRVTVGGVGFEIFPLSLTLADLVIPGDRPGAADFARVRRIEIEADFEGWRESVVRLGRVAVEGARVALELREDGDNLPRPRGGGSGGRALAVQIGGLSVSDSEVLLDDRRVPLTLEARALLARFSGLGGTNVDGSVTAQEIRLGLPEAQPVAFTFAAKARLLADHLEFSNARLLTRGLTAHASGRVRWRDKTAVDFAAAVDGDGSFLDRLGYLHGDIVGMFHAEGTFGWSRENWGWRARVSSPGLDLFGFRVGDLDGVASGDGEAVRFDLEGGRFAGGAARGTFTVGIRRPYPATLDVALDGGVLDSVLERFHVPVRGFDGRVSGSLRYAFAVRAAERGIGRGEFEIAAAAPARAGAVPASGRATVVLDGGELELPAFSLTTADQAVSGLARLALHSGDGEVELEVRSQDLGGLPSHLALLEPGALWLPTAGTGVIGARVGLAGGHASVSLALELASVVAPGLSADTVRGTLAVTPRAAEGIDLAIRRGPATLALTGRLPLDPRQESLDLVLSAEGWPAADARPWLPFALPLAGPIHGELRLAGSPAAPTGRLAASCEPVTVAGVVANRLDVTLDWDARRVAVERAELATEAGSLGGRGTLELEGDGLDFQLASAGLALDRAPLAAIGRGRLGGRLVVDARLTGTLARPDLDLEGRIEQATLAGAPLGDQPAPLALRLAEGHLEATLEVPALARLTGGGAFALDAPSRLDFRLASERLDRLVALVAGPATVPGLGGRLDAELAFDLAPGEAPAVALRVPQLEFTLAGQTLHSLEPVAVRVDEHGVRIDSFYLGLPGSEDELFVAGRIGSEDDPALDLNVQASLDAAWLRPWAGGLDLTGRIAALGRVGGTLGRPQLNGQAELTDGRFLPPLVPHSVEHLTALVWFYPDAMVLDHLEAAFAGGAVTGSGRVDLPRAGQPLAYRFEAAARRVAPRWPPGWQLRGDADLSLASTAEGRQLRGEVRLDRAWYLQDIDLSPAQLIQRLLARNRVEVAVTDEPLLTTTLGVVVRGPRAVRVRNNMARLDGGADLVVRGTLARPVVFGQVTLEPGGTASYGGNTYTLERAAVSFANPTRIEPLLDVVARTRVSEYSVQVNLSGSLERLNTSFSSDPPLPDLDILGLLATGAPTQGGTLSELPPEPGTPGQESTSAGALLYGQAAALLTQRVGKLFGFDQVQVRPLTTGDTLSTAAFTVGKRISRQLHVTYSVDPSSTAQQVLQVEWLLTDRLTLVLTQNGNESYSVDARWESRF
jgi:hypothetical protein